MPTKISSRTQGEPSIRQANPHANLTRQFRISDILGMECYNGNKTCRLEYLVVRATEDDRGNSVASVRVWCRKHSPFGRRYEKLRDHRDPVEDGDSEK